MKPYASMSAASDFHSDTRAFFRGRIVAITGGTGFIGSHVVEQLLRLGAKPIVLSRTSNPKFLRNCLSGIEIRECDLESNRCTLKAFEGASAVLNLAAKV